MDEWPWPTAARPRVSATHVHKDHPSGATLLQIVTSHVVAGAQGDHFLAALKLLGLELAFQVADHSLVAT